MMTTAAAAKTPSFNVPPYLSPILRDEDDNGRTIKNPAFNLPPSFQFPGAMITTFGLAGNQIAFDLPPFRLVFFDFLSNV